MGVKIPTVLQDLAKDHESLVAKAIEPERILADILCYHFFPTAMEGTSWEQRIYKTYVSHTHTRTRAHTHTHCKFQSTNERYRIGASLVLFTRPVTWTTVIRNAVPRIKIPTTRAEYTTPAFIHVAS